MRESETSVMVYRPCLIIVEPTLNRLLRQDPRRNSHDRVDGHEVGRSGYTHYEAV